MGRYVVRDPATREFEIDESALPFWKHREGYTIVDPVSTADEKPVAGAPAEPAAGEPAPPEESGNPAGSTTGRGPDKSPTTPKTSTNAGKIVDK